MYTSLSFKNFFKKAIIAFPIACTFIFLIFTSITITITINTSSSAFANDTNTTRTSNTIAGNYFFKGRKYILSPYIDVAPRKIHRQGLGNNKNLDDLINLDGIPHAFDIKNLQSSVKNQSDRGSCAYFAAAAFVEGLIKAKMNIEVNISEEFIIYYTKAVLGWSTNSEGSGLIDNVNFLKDNGLVLEKYLHYDPSWFEKGLPCEGYKSEDRNAPKYCFSHNEPPQYVFDSMITINELEISSISLTTESIVKYLAQKKLPVLVSLPLNSNGWNGESGECDYTETERKECKTDPKKCGYHSILLVGFNIENKKFIFKNSWGNDWGKEGYGTIPFAYIEQYSMHNPVVGELKKDLELPEDYNKMDGPITNNINFIIKDDKVTNPDSAADDNASLDDDNASLKVTAEVNIQNISGRTFYTSTFISYKKDNVSASEAIDDNNSELMSVPANLNAEYGAYVRGTFYKIFNHDENQTSFSIEGNPITNTIPYKIIDSSILKNKEAYFRVSMYVHDDIDGWHKFFRNYVKWQPVE
ncbi:MAG: C1 family peptidase [Oligoflexia bacterium]|nr:C1 family peptidase [Oligoflexia bacterium]